MTQDEVPSSLILWSQFRSQLVFRPILVALPEQPFDLLGDPPRPKWRALRALIVQRSLDIHACRCDLRLDRYFQRLFANSLALQFYWLRFGEFYPPKVWRSFGLAKPLTMQTADVTETR